MQGQRRRDTGPELRLRRTVHATGMRYRVDARPVAELRWRADLVFVRPKVAVFVDGCWWHGCDQHFRPAKANGEWWAEKIARNVARDREADEALGLRGWLVLRFWEHDDAAVAATRVAVEVAERNRVSRR